MYQEEDLSWAGVYRSFDSYISAEYVNEGVQEGTVVTTQFMYSNPDELEKITRGVMLNMFLEAEEFIIDFKTDAQILNLHVSWDNIISFLDAVKNAKETHELRISGKVTHREE